LTYELTQVAPGKYFGVIPIQNSKGSSFVGLSKVKYSWLGFPRQEVGFIPAPVKTRELKNPADLRIPASFFEEVEKSQDEISQQKALINSTISKITDNDKKDFCFAAKIPLHSKIVSLFGSFRKLPTGKEYFHTGLDLRAWTGTPIRAMSDGTVVLARGFVTPGNAVYIDHGYGIYSKYFHLSEIKVHEGQKIRMGELVGKSGATGRVEAPHFHWEVAWKGISTDPQEFLKISQEICSKVPASFSGGIASKSLNNIRNPASNPDIESKNSFFSE
jgi:murein DD-endopeptidase MepM/ murein hydrolase activator NlpD